MIRKMTQKDLTEVLKIENESFVNGRYSLTQFKDEFKNPFATLIVSENNKDIDGFLIYMITFNSATIVQIAVDSNKREKGIGSELLNHMFKHFESLGYGKIETVTLEVRKQNDVAHKFYLKNGFKDVVTKKEYYTNGDDAIYMQRILL